MNTFTDAIEALLFLKNNPLPKDEQTRVKILTLLTYDTIFYLYYDSICKYSRSFREAYDIDTIKSIIRKGNIMGNNLEDEFKKSNLTEEEQLIIRLFLKGR